MKKRVARMRIPDRKEVLTLDSVMSAGRYIGGVVKDIIEHDPFEVKRLVNNKAITLNECTAEYLKKVYNRKKNGRSW